MTLHRREFLRHIAAGGALAAAPVLLPGCATQAPSDGVDTPTLDNPFTSWFGLDESSINRVMSALTANGADIADAYFELASSHRMVFENGEVRGAETEARRGAGLRVVRDGKVDFASTEALDLTSLLDTASSVARGAPKSIPWQASLVTSRDLYPVTVSWTDVTQAEKLSLMQAIEARARAADPAVESVAMRWESSEQTILVATLDGQLVTDVRPLARLSLVVTAARGDVRQTGFSNVAARAGLDWYTEERIAALVQEAVDRTLVQFEARRAPAGDMPVILAAGTGGVLLHEGLGHGLEADLVDDSAFAGQLGNKVAESFVTIVDEAHMERESGALNVDDEGAATGRNVLVENGVFSTSLQDRVSALANGVSPTGSGRRESFRHLPMPRMTCTFMADGPHARDEIIAAVKDGVICETFSGGRAELGPGGFRFNVKNGWIVEDGKITAPTKDFTISGNGPDMLRKITMAADDSRMDAGGWLCGKNGQTVPVSQGMPTVLVSALTVS
jgi:TldD protein